MEVKSVVQDIDPVTKQIKVSIPAETVTQEISSAITDLAARANLKGFRPGKAPRAMVEKLHGPRVRLEVANRLISNSLSKLVKDHSIDMIGAPEIDVASFEPGKEIEYTAQVSVFPKPEIVGYDSLKVSVPKGEITDEDVEQVIERIRQSKATTKKLDFRNVAQKGDVVDAALLVELEGEPPSRPEPLVVGLGEGKVPVELEDGIVGMEVGQSKEIVTVVEAEHPNKQIAGKKTTYKVTLNGLSERVLPELTDDFVKGLSFGPQTVLELRIETRKQLEEQAAQELKEKTHQAILDQLLEKNEFPVPNVLIDDEIRNLLVRNGVLDPKRADIEKLNMEPFRERLGEVAKKRVRTAVLVDAVGKKEGIKASDDDINAALKDIADKNGLPVEEVRKFFLQSEQNVGFFVELGRNKVLDFLHGKAEVSFVAPEKGAGKESAEKSASKGKK
jgi:trigger factor